MVNCWSTVPCFRALSTAERRSSSSKSVLIPRFRNSTHSDTVTAVFSRDGEEILKTKYKIETIMISHSSYALAA